MARTKKKKKKDELGMKLKFRDTSLAENFLLILLDEFPEGDFRLGGDGITINIYSPRESFTEIRELSSFETYGRCGISTYVS